MDCEFLTCPYCKHNHGDPYATERTFFSIGKKVCESCGVDFYYTVIELTDWTYKCVKKKPKEPKKIRDFTLNITLEGGPLDGDTFIFHPNGSLLPPAGLIYPRDEGGLIAYEAREPPEWGLKRAKYKFKGTVQ